MKTVKRLTALVVALTMLFSAFVFTATEAAAAVTPLGLVLQKDAKWKSYYYGGGNLYNTGCGIFSLVNAVGYLTGKRMSVTDTAKWFHDIGGYNVTGGEGTYRTVVYPKVQAKYGGTYGFTVDCGSGNTGYWSGSSSTKLKSHLANGGVAVGHVPGHFIALVGYDYSTNKFHVYDSYPTSARGTLSGNGNCWVTQSHLATGKLKLDWFCLLTYAGTTPVEPEVTYETGEYKMLGTKHLRDVASSTYNTLVNVPTGEVMSVTKIVNKRYGYTQYGDFVGYIYLDEDVQRIGALDTNRVTTITSPDVRYADAAYTATWSDVQGASGYRYKVIQLDGEPDPGNSNESANATVLYDSTTYITQTLSVTIPAEKMTNGKYLKIAVQTVFPDKSPWTFMYVTPSMLPFTDISITSWMYDPALYCYNAGLMNGVNTTSFVPNGEATVAMICTVAHKLAGSPEPSADAVMPYANVADTAWYYKSLLWCVENNIVRTYETPTFDYASPLSREMAILYFYRLADLMKKNDKVLEGASMDMFTDTADIDKNCLVAVQWAVGKGLIHGSDGKINPKANTNRIQLATMLQNVDIFISGVDETYNPVTRGDVNNSGAVDTTDYICLKLHLKNVTQIAAPFMEAADHDGDRNVSSSDVISLAKRLKG